MEKKYLNLLYILITLALTILGCKFETPPTQTTGGTVSLSGQVVDNITGNAIGDVSVTIIGGTSNQGLTTNNSGSFSTDVNIDQDKELTLIANRSGYDPDTIAVYAAVGSKVNNLILKLNQNESSNGNSSEPANSIYLYSQSDKSIGVKESGSNETAQIIFEILDKSGIPISSDQAVTISFKFGSNPGGGEYLYPASVKSNSLGRASVTLNTGTKAGVAQIIAQMTVNEKTISSRPVLISIHGGFPDQNHFDVASDKLNYPEYGIVGYEIKFTAFVGDKYTNPVRTGTSVYFDATSGIIEGSNLTDDLGRSTVTYLTQPFPNLNEPGYGAGFFRVTASTIDENNENIQTSTVRLLSGLPVMTVDPATFNIPNGGSQTFNYTVSDGNGNPLAEGQTISVKVSEGDLKVSGDVQVKLLDTQSKAFTFFSFTAYDAKPDTIKSNKAVIDIETTGPNGDKKISISGTAQ